MLGIYRGGTAVRGIVIGDPPWYAWAINLNASKGQIGQVLWNKTYTPPPGNTTISFGRASQEDRVWTIWCKEYRKHYGYSLDTGNLLWGPTEPAETQLGIFETWTIFYDHKLYTHGTKGTVDCYDAKTGEHLWIYEAIDPYTECLWSNNWVIRVDFIADGKIYLRQSEHSANNPKPRGAPYICLNATTGEEIWRINGGYRGTDWGGRGFIGDSIIAKFNTYDGQIFAIGKGPSATTVTAPDIGVPLGSSVTIRGTVMDISPGTKDYALAARFPSGVPAVADESMSDWMKHVYNQFERPTNASGVEVVLSVLDSNGNYREIGKAISDSNGFYSLQWIPDISGKYTVYANFAGSKSYWPSSAETAMSVDEPPPEVPEEEPITQNVATFPMEGMYAITGIFIVVILVMGLLLFKKKQ